jgi:hypothetical protein
MTEPPGADHVFERVQTCLRNVVGGSGHLASYRLDRESFVLTACRSLDDGHAEYEFAVEGVRSSEFDSVSDEDAPETLPGCGDVTERLEGSIVLDAEGTVVTDETGRIRLHPWRTLHRDRPSGADDGIETLLDELDGRD